MYNTQIESKGTTLQNMKPNVDATIIDGAFMVQMFSPNTSRTFQEYADHIFFPAILEQIKTVRRVDVVWDV